MTRSLTHSARAAPRLAIALAVVLLGAGPEPGWAGSGRGAAELVEHAKSTIENVAVDPKMAAFNKLIQRARGVLVVPQLLKAALVLGASGGSAVLAVRDERSGIWQGPAFYTLAGASVGLQIGAQASEVVVLAMTERGVTAMLRPRLKLGVDASLAGPIGPGLDGATENSSADLVVFSRSKGLYGGVSLQGAILAERTEWNHAYYGMPVTATDILVRGEGANLQAERLLAAIRQLARASKAEGGS